MIRSSLSFIPNVKTRLICFFLSFFLCSYLSCHRMFFFFHIYLQCVFVSICVKHIKFVIKNMAEYSQMKLIKKTTHTICVGMKNWIFWNWHWKLHRFSNYLFDRKQHTNVAANYHRFILFHWNVCVSLSLSLSPYFYVVYRYVLYIIWGVFFPLLVAYFLSKFCSSENSPTAKVSHHKRVKYFP